MLRVSSAIFLAVSLALFVLGACEENRHAADGDEYTVPDSEENENDAADLDAEAEGPCEQDTLRCDDNVLMRCKNGEWRHERNCGLDGLICRNATCVEPETDGDLEPDAEPEDEREAPPDTTAPTLISITPGDGALVETSLVRATLVFSEPLNPKEFVPQRDISFDDGCQPFLFQGALEDRDRQITISFAYLIAGTTYTVTVAPNRLQDLAGNLFPGTSFSFTTRGESPADTDRECIQVDTTPPVIAYSQPADRATRVSLDLDSVQVVFSEKLDVEDYDTASNISLVGEDSHTPALSSAWHNGNKILNVTLTGGPNTLHAATRYTLSISEGLTDLAGNPLGAPSIRFTTIGVSDGDLDAEPEAEPDIEIFESEEETEDPVANTGELAATDWPHACKLDPEFYKPEDFPQSVVALWDADKAALTITHANAVYDQAIDDLWADFSQSGLLLELFEMSRRTLPAKGVCPRDVSYRIVNLLPGQFTVKVYPQGSANAFEALGTVPTR